MADGFSAKVYYQQAVADLAKIDVGVNRATMWGLRETGRKVKSAARRQAPVYNGPRKDIPRGRLRNSIHSDKRLKGSAGSYSLRVGPRGYPASAYAGKQEARKPFMAPAQAQASAQAPAIFARAWGRAARRF